MLADEVPLAAALGCAVMVHEVVGVPCGGVWCKAGQEWGEVRCGVVGLELGWDVVA